MSAAGLKAGAQVDMAGVEIGQVADLRLDNQRQVAIVSLKIKKEVMLTDDVIASVKTSGLIRRQIHQVDAGRFGPNT